jgi:tetratricopeptide (TPR) repeat protein
MIVANLIYTVMMKVWFGVILLVLMIPGGALAQQAEKIEDLHNELASAHDPFLTAQLHLKLARIYLDEFDLENAQREAAESYSGFSALKVDSLLQRSAKLLGIISIYQNKIDTAFHFLSEANAIGQSIHDSAVVSSTFAIHANIYNRIMTRPDQALLYMDSAELFYQKKQLKERIFGKIVKGTIFVNVGSYDLALQEFYAGLDLATTDSVQITSLYNNIGTVFLDIGDYEGAKKSYAKAIVYSRKDMRQLGISNYNLALLHKKEGNFDEALKYGSAAIDLLKQQGTARDIFQAMLTTSQLYFERSEVGASHQIFIDIDTTNINHEEKLQWYALGAKIQYSNFTFISLETLFQELQPFITDYVQVKIAAMLYEHFRSAGKIQKALRYKEISSDLKDSVFASDKVIETQRIMLNRIVREKNEGLYEKEQRNLELQHSVALNEERDLRWNYSIGFVIVLLLGGIYFIYFLYKTNRQKLQQQLLEIEKEKGRRTILLNHLDEARKNLAANNEELVSLREKGSQEAQTADSAETLINNLNDRNWPNFLSEFELLYPSFFDRLDEISSAGLSRNERRLCCFIKLRLANKEIAEYVFVSPDSVKKAKNRLFKKIAIDGSQVREASTRIQGL